MKKTFKVSIVRDGSSCFIPVPFDPRAVFGKVRAPVTVTVNGYSFSSTIASMGNGPCVPLRRSNREAAGLDGTETLEVTLELDAKKREAKPPADLVRALKARPAAWERWQALSYTHQREHVEALALAKKPETRLERLNSMVEALTSGAAKTKKKAASKAAAPRAGKPKLNAPWHEDNPMPKKPSTEQRLQWHLEHERNCGCRPMPERLRALIN
jgi:hypothetical protein